MLSLSERTVLIPGDHLFICASGRALSKLDLAWVVADSRRVGHAQH